jgi:hypothetical protein
MTTFQIRPGFILIDTCHCSGGVSRAPLKDETTETINQGNGLSRDYKGHVEIDHVEIKEAMDKVVGAARHIITRKFGVATPLGCVLDAEALKAVDAVLAPLKAEAEALNARAKAEGSARRAYIGYAPAALMLDHEATAVEIYRAIRQKLGKLRDAFRAGDVKKVNAAVAGCKGIQRLAVGIQADAVRFAVDTVASLREGLHDALDKGQTPESAGAALDLDAIESAIVMFTPSEETQDAAVEADTADEPLSMLSAVA